MHVDHTLCVEKGKRGVAYTEQQNVTPVNSEPMVSEKLGVIMLVLASSRTLFILLIDS